MPGTPPTAPNSGAPRYSDADGVEFSAQVNAVTDAIDACLPPIGSIIDYAGTTEPVDGSWLFPDGRAISRSEFADLFAVIGTAFGAGNGTTTFNLPDLRGRVGVGADNFGSGAGAAGRLPNNNRALGEAGGTDVLTTSHLPNHEHAFASSSGTVFGIVPWQGGGNPVPGAAMIPPGGYNGGGVRIVGGGQDNPAGSLPPYQVVNKLIRAK